MTGRYTRTPKTPADTIWEDDGRFEYQDAGGRPVVAVTRQLAFRPAAIGAKTGNKEPLISEETGKQVKRCPQFWFGYGEKPEHIKTVPIYRLKKVIEAVKNQRIVFVVEGEKKAEALIDWGYAATCNLGGAGKWEDAHSAELRGADVVVVPDNDQPGRHHSDIVGRSLLRFAKRIRLLELPGLPEAGDIVDWIREGGTKERFAELVAGARDWQPYSEATENPSLLRWHGDARPSPPRWLIRNRVPETGLGSIGGQWGSFKSFMALDICGAVMTGLPWTGEPVYRPGGVLYFAPEGGSGLPMRLQAMIEHKLLRELERPDLLSEPPTINIERMPFCWFETCPLLLEKNAQSELLKMVRAAQSEMQERFATELVLIIFDTLAASAGWTNEDKSAEVIAALRVLRNLSRETGTMVLVVDHYGKDTATGMRGSSAKEDTHDCILVAMGEKAENGAVADTRLLVRKVREGESGIEIPFDAEIVEMGDDEHGNRLTSRIIKWDVLREERPPGERKRSQSATVLEQVLTATLEEHGETILANGPEGKRAVRRDLVREAFAAAWRQVSRSASKDSVRQRFNMGLRDAGAVAETVSGVEYLRWPDSAI